MKTDEAPASREELRPLLHQKIDQLDQQALALTHRFIREIELDKEIASLQEDFGGESFDVERANEAIRKFRKANPYR